MESRKRAGVTGIAGAITAAPAPLRDPDLHAALS